MTPTPEDIEVATLIEHVAWCPAHLDITVQRANDHPIAVIHRLGDFERVEAKHPTEKP